MKKDFQNKGLAILNKAIDSFLKISALNPITAKFFLIKNEIGKLVQIF